MGSSVQNSDVVCSLSLMSDRAVLALKHLRSNSLHCSASSQLPSDRKKMEVFIQMNGYCTRSLPYISDRFSVKYNGHQGGNISGKILFIYTNRHPSSDIYQTSAKLQQPV